MKKVLQPQSQPKHRFVRKPSHIKVCPAGKKPIRGTAERLSLMRGRGATQTKNVCTEQGQYDG